MFFFKTRNVSKTVDLKLTSLSQYYPYIHVTAPFLAPSSSSKIFNITILSIIHMILFEILHFQWLIKAIMLYEKRPS